MGQDQDTDRLTYPGWSFTTWWDRAPGFDPIFAAQIQWGKHLTGRPLGLWRPVAASTSSTPQWTRAAAAAVDRARGATAGTGGGVL